MITDPQNRMWRTGSGTNGNEIYALLYNDVTKASRNDLLIGAMDTPALADNVVDMHNRVLRRFGRHYIMALKTDG